MSLYKLNSNVKRVRSVIINVSMAAICTIFISGCILGPTNDRFPNLKADVAALSTVDVVLDVTVLAEIEGDAIGINRENHLTTIRESKAAIQEKFTKLGAKANFIYAGSGIFHSNLPDTEYFYSKNYKSTGEVFRGYELTIPIGEPENLAFLRTVALEAEKYNRKKRKRDANIEPLHFKNIPPYFNESYASRLAIIRIFRNNVSFEKNDGKSAFAETLLMHAGGGFSVGMGPTYGLKTAVSIALIDTRTGRLIWQTWTTDARSPTDAVLDSALSRIDFYR